MIRKLTLALLAFVICVKAEANDSTKIRSKQFLINLDFSIANRQSGTNPKSALLQSNYSFDIYNWYEFALGFQYQLKAFKYKTSTCLVNAGLGVGYSTFKFSEGVSDWDTHQYDHFPTYYSYSPNNMISKRETGTLLMFLSLIREGHGVYLSQKLGAKYFFSSQKQLQNNYEESATHSGLTSTTTDYFNHEDVFTFSDFITPYYNLDFGLKFGSFYPTIGLETMYYSGNVSYTQRNYSYTSSYNPGYAAGTAIKNEILIRAKVGLTIRL